MYTILSTLTLESTYLRDGKETCTSYQEIQSVYILFWEDDFHCVCVTREDAEEMALAFFQDKEFYKFNQYMLFNHEVKDAIERVKDWDLGAGFHIIERKILY